MKKTILLHIESRQRRQAVWELAEHRYVYVVQQPEHAGHTMHTLFVDALIVQIAEKGLDAAKQETYSNGVRRSNTATPTETRSGLAALHGKPFSLTQRSECWLKPKRRLGGEDRLE